MQWIAPSEKDAANDTLEKRLWGAADQLRANSFNYYRQITGTDAKPVKVQNTPGTQLVIDSLPAGATVQVTVTAVNDAGEGQSSAPITVVVT